MPPTEQQLSQQIPEYQKRIPERPAPQQQATAPVAAPARPTPPPAPLAPTPPAPAAPPALRPEETTESRMQGLLSGNSSYMQLAKTQGLQQAQNRGLLNSTIAVGASQDAAMRAALPIASEDAGRAFGRSEAGFQRTHEQKLQAQAEFARDALSRLEAGQKLTQSEYDAALNFRSQLQAEQSRSELSSQESRQQFENATNLAAQQGSLNMQLAEFNAGSARDLAQMQMSHQMLLNASAQAQAQFVTMNDQIMKIMTDPKLNRDAKVNAVNTLISFYNDAFALQAEVMRAGGFDMTGVELDYVTGSGGQGQGVTPPAGQPVPPGGTTNPTPENPSTGGGGQTPQPFRPI